MNIEESRSIEYKIQAHLFSKALEKYRSLPRWSFLLGKESQRDMHREMFVRLQGIKRLARRKYVVYNQAIDYPECKMFYKCFDWLK